MLNYPLHLNFKKLALAHQISVTDANDNLIWYVKQKAFKLKEQVTVYADREQTRALFEINADRMIDFAARYTIRNAGPAYGGAVNTTGAPGEIGKLQRRGMRSFWKARYEIERAGSPSFSAEEENPWAKVADGLMCEIPLLGLLSGYVFHPRYLVTTAAEQEVMRIEKQAAFLEGKFEIEKLAAVNDTDETLVLLSVMMIVLLERARG